MAHEQEDRDAPHGRERHPLGQEARLDALEARIQQALELAAQHSERHIDQGDDPFQQASVSGHGHEHADALNQTSDDHHNRHEIRDDDDDTGVRAEESADEDILRFDVAGTEYAQINATRFSIDHLLSLPAESVTIDSSGDATIAKSVVQLSANSGTADTLEKIVPGANFQGALVALTPAQGHTITVDHGVLTNDPRLPDGKDVILANAFDDWLVLYKASSTAWQTLLLWREADRYFEFTWTIEDPTSSEDVTIHRFTNAVTIVELVCTVVGSSTPSVTIDPKHAADRSAAGTALLSSATAITNTTTGQTITSFNDATLVANSALWLETTAQSGTVDELSIKVKGFMD